MIGSHVIFTVRPWDGTDGDPGAPRRVLGIGVARRLCSRPDGAGALVALGDRRYALTGRNVAIGSPRQLRWHIRRRAPWALPSEERAWLAQVIEALDAARSATNGSVLWR